MRTVEQVVEFMQDVIAFAYQRPDMVNLSADGLDLVLQNNHHLWAEIVGRHDEFYQVFSDVCMEVGSGTDGFARHFRREMPNASEQELCGHVIAEWKRIGERLKMLVPCQ